MRNICLFFISILSLNLIFAQNNSFNGVFLNKEINLKITVEELNGIYSGTYLVQNNSFPITAQINENNSLIGTYPYFDNNVPIQIMKMEGQFMLITEGVTIPMTFTPSNTTQIVGTSATSINTNKIITENNNKLATQKKTKKIANGQLFKDINTGFMFNIPSDWVGQVNTDGGYLIGHNTKPGFILVIPNEYETMSNLRTDFTKGVQEEGFYLTLSNELTKYSKEGLIGNYEGIIQGQNSKAVSIGLLSPYNSGGLTIIIGVRSDLFTEGYTTIIQSIANSVIFSKPSVSPIAGKWKRQLTGKKLQYMKTANGFSDKIIIGLCPNGDFSYYSNSSGMSGGMDVLTYAGQNKNHGRWHIKSSRQNGILILTFSNGEVYEYTLSTRVDSGAINLNGSRYFVLNDGC